MDKKLKTKSKQGKMDPKKPFDKISKYDSEEESEQDASEIEDRAPSSSASSYSFRSSSSSVIDNILLANLKGKELLGGVDFCLVMCKKQGKGAKNLKGNELKKHLQWKEQKMIIAKLALAGANVAEMEPFIKSSKVHLTSSSAYNAISCGIIASICNLLSTVCFMENVDTGVFAEYFNRRFADLRNRRNYTAMYYPLSIV